MANNENPKTEFSPYVIEQIGWYVYALQDPRDKKIFYIGKGKSNRVFAHASDATEDETSELNLKLDLIRQIHAENLSVNTFILRHGLSSEKVAYEVEAALIDLLYLMDTSGNNPFFHLTNQVRGHHHERYGARSAQYIATLYEAPPCPEIMEKAVLFRIPVRWNPLMSPEELFESTHGWWRLGTRKGEADLAFAVSAGVIRAIYKIESWDLRKEGDRGFKDGEKPRFGFKGHAVDGFDQYLNKSVKHLFKVGEQSPFKYLNC